MVMLTLLLLGVSFFALSYNYTCQPSGGTSCRTGPVLMAQLSVDYLKSGGTDGGEDAQRFIRGWPPAP